MRKFKLEFYDINSKHLPKLFSGYKIVFLTDLHSMVYGEDNQILLDAIRSQKPDCIMAAGDMIVAGAEFDETVSLKLMQQLCKHYPVYYSLGNHEKRLSICEEIKNTAYLNYVEQLKKMGVHYLANESLTIQREEQCIQITGLDMDIEFYNKVFHHKEMHETYLEEKLGKKTENYTILLAHNPSYFPQYSKWGADLVLSGHVHGGIVILPVLGGMISPSYELFPKYDFGKFELFKSQMILSRGLGVHTIKFRLWNRPELAVITLK